MNTKLFKVVAACLSVGCLVWLAYLTISKSDKSRFIANANGEQIELTEGQQIKWTTTEQFKILQTNESLQIEVPHVNDVCLNNQSIEFIFTAYEVSYSGVNPEATLRADCEKLLHLQKMMLEVQLSDLAALQTLKNSTHEFFDLSAKSLYSDEALPESWMLSGIRLTGQNSFEINPFEIKAVHNQNFEFRLSR